MIFCTLAEKPRLQYNQKRVNHGNPTTQLKLGITHLAKVWVTRVRTHACKW